MGYDKYAKKSTNHPVDVLLSRASEYALYHRQGTYEVAFRNGLRVAIFYEHHGYSDAPESWDAKRQAYSFFASLTGEEPDVSFDSIIESVEKSFVKGGGI